MFKPLLAGTVFMVSVLAAMTSIAKAETRTAIFAGGCFWCVEADFDKVPGVLSTVSGYAGGKTQNPTYRNYASGGHREVVKIEFDDAKVNFRTLADILLRTIDPTDAGGQFCDRGESYSSAIYALDAGQKDAAQKAVAEANTLLGGSVVTPVLGTAKFWPAEDYHQDYYRSKERILTRFGYVTKADAYKGYRKGCGRDARVRQVWGNAAFQGIGK